MARGALARQHPAAGFRGHECFPRRAADGKASSLISVLLGRDGDGSSSGMAAFVSYWGQMSRHFSVMLLCLGKLKVEMPSEEHASGMSTTGSVP